MSCIRKENTIALAGLLLAAVGCGASDSGSTRYVSGVDGNKDVATLDATEKQQLCDSVDAYVSGFVDLDAVAYVACIPGAIWTTTTPEACRQSLSNCMALFPRPIQVDAKLQSDAACLSSLAQCQTTVAALEGCVDVSLSRTLSVLDWSCELAGDPSARAMAEPRSDVQVCTSVNAACNQFAEPGPE